MNELEPFNPLRFEQLAIDRQWSLGRPLIFHPTTTSTNDVAMRLCQEGAPHGLVVVTDHQSQGRGRRGRVWCSPHPGESLLFSVILRLRTESEWPSNITLAMGLALRDALQPNLEQAVTVKWPNDVLVNAKKLAGILVESQLLDGQLSAFVVGIGLNVDMRELPDSITSVATSLALLRARVLEREVILADILRAIDERARAWQNIGFPSMVSELYQCDALRGRQISVDGVSGRSLGVDDSGALLFQADGETKPRRILNGIVELLDAER
jgi:BirA family biotin operon repressor/biotin-[acetyl-CoA-carboxylase] ligase